MSRAGSAEQLVRRRYTGDALEIFLQLALGIFDYGDAVRVGEFILKNPPDKVTRSVQPAVEIQRGDQRFKDILQRGVLPPVKVGLLAPAQDKVLPDAKRIGLGRQLRAFDQPVAVLVQVTFFLFGPNPFTLH